MSLFEDNKHVRQEVVLHCAGITSCCCFSQECTELTISNWKQPQLQPVRLHTQCSDVGPRSAPVMSSPSHLSLVIVGVFLVHLLRPVHFARAAPHTFTSSSSCEDMEHHRPGETRRKREGPGGTRREQKRPGKTRRDEEEPDETRLEEEMTMRR